MCTIPYQKCVCFVLLVVLAVLSCSGFRIDNLAMTEVSRTAPAAAHRLRHRRQMGTVARRRPQCPEFDASWKAYRADAVAVAAVESRSSRCRGDCAVQFKILRWLKNPKPYDDRLVRLTFRTERPGRTRCDYGDLVADKPYFLVNNDQSKGYILFLKTDGPHSYAPAFAPELNKTKTFRTVSRVSAPHFLPRPVRLEKINRVENRPKRLKLVCRVQGLPIPIIHWQVNNTLLHPSNNKRIKITQKKKRSTLVIRNFTEADWGQYKCVAQDVNGNSHNVSHTIGRPGSKPTVSHSDRKPCPDKMRENFCWNGGTCFYVESMLEYSCVCATGYTGQKCESKLSDQSSMYRQTPIYTCKVGLYTKNDNC